MPISTITVCQKRTYIHRSAQTFENRRIILLELEVILQLKVQLSRLVNKIGKEMLPLKVLIITITFVAL